MLVYYLDVFFIFSVLVLTQYTLLYLNIVIFLELPYFCYFQKHRNNHSFAERQFRDWYSCYARSFQEFWTCNWCYIYCHHRFHLYILSSHTGKWNQKFTSLMSRAIHIDVLIESLLLLSVACKTWLNNELPM